MNKKQYIKISFWIVCLSIGMYSLGNAQDKVGIRIDSDSGIRVSGTDDVQLRVDGNVTNNNIIQIDAMPLIFVSQFYRTSMIKDMYVESGRSFIPFLELLADLVSRGVAIRLIHAKDVVPAKKR